MSSGCTRRIVAIITNARTIADFARAVMLPRSGQQSWRLTVTRASSVNAGFGLGKPKDFIGGRSRSLTSFVHRLSFSESRSPAAFRILFTPMPPPPRFESLRCVPIAAPYL